MLQITEVTNGLGNNILNVFIITSHLVMGAFRTINSTEQPILR